MLIYLYILNLSRCILINCINTFDTVKPRLIQTAKYVGEITHVEDIDKFYLQLSQENTNLQNLNAKLNFVQEKNTNLLKFDEGVYN